MDEELSLEELKSLARAILARLTPQQLAELIQELQQKKQQ